MSNVDPNDLVLGDDDIGMSDEELLNMTKRKRLGPGWYASITDNVKKKIADSGSMIIEWEDFPLEDPDDRNTVTTPAQRDSIILPFKNPKVEDHTAPNTMGLVQAKLRGLFGDDFCPRHPVFDKTTKEWSYKGEVIAEDEVDQCRIECNKFATEILREFWNGKRDLEQFNGVFSYIEVGEEKKGWVNVENRYQTLPDDKELVKPPFGIK